MSEREIDDDVRETAKRIHTRHVSFGRDAGELHELIAAALQAERNRNTDCCRRRLDAEQRCAQLEKNCLQMSECVTRANTRAEAAEQRCKELEQRNMLLDAVANAQTTLRDDARRVARVLGLWLRYVTKAPPEVLAAVQTALGYPQQKKPESCEPCGGAKP